MLKMSEVYLEPTRTSTMEFENDPNFLPVKKRHYWSEEKNRFIGGFVGFDQYLQVKNISKEIFCVES